MDYRKLMVKILKEIVENDYCRIIVHDNGDISGEDKYGFKLEDSTVVLGSFTEREIRNDFNISNEIPLEKLKLTDGYLGEVFINYNENVYNEDEMEIIADDIYEILGEEFGLMTVEANGYNRKF